MKNFFLRHFVGNNEQDTITFRARDQRETKTGVAGGSFDDGAARLQFSFLLRGFNHRQCDTVFDRAGRILIFQF